MVANLLKVGAATKKIVPKRPPAAIMMPKAPKQKMYKPKLNDDEEYAMSYEVKEWIDNAHSKLTYYVNRVQALEEEIRSLRRNNKIMEQRVMGMSFE
jgi:hypothetical protein